MVAEGPKAIMNPWPIAPITPKDLDFAVVNYDFTSFAGSEQADLPSLECSQRRRRHSRRLYGILHAPRRRRRWQFNRVRRRTSSGSSRPTERRMRQRKHDRGLRVHR